jgi:large subunit ribosomal protein L11
MSKVAKKVVKAMSKKTIAKIDHGNRMETYIPSGKAVAGPPLGPQLGQVCSLLLLNSSDDFF